MKALTHGLATGVVNENQLRMPTLEQTESSPYAVCCSVLAGNEAKLDLHHLELLNYPVMVTGQSDKIFTEPRAIKLHRQYVPGCFPLE